MRSRRSEAAAVAAGIPLVDGLWRSYGLERPDREQLPRAPIAGTGNKVSLFFFPFNQISQPFFNILQTLSRPLRHLSCSSTHLRRTIRAERPRGLALTSRSSNVPTAGRFLPPRIAPPSETLIRTAIAMEALVLKTSGTARDWRMGLMNAMCSPPDRGG